MAPAGALRVVAKGLFVITLDHRPGVWAGQLSGVDCCDLLVGQGGDEFFEPVIVLNDCVGIVEDDDIAVGGADSAVEDFAGDVAVLFGREHDDARPAAQEIGRAVAGAVVAGDEL